MGMTLSLIHIFRQVVHLLRLLGLFCGGSESLGREGQQLLQHGGGFLAMLLHAGVDDINLAQFAIGKLLAQGCLLYTSRCV